MAQNEIPQLTLEIGWSLDTNNIEISQVIFEIGRRLNPPLAMAQMPIEVAYFPTIHTSYVSQAPVEVAFRYLPYTGPTGISGYGVAHHG